MSVETDIQDKAVAALKLKSAVISASAGVFSAGQLVEDPMQPLLIVTCSGRQNLAGPLYQADLSIMANVANAPDPNKSLLSTLEGVISDFLKELKATPSTLNPASGSAYSVDGLDDSIPQPKLDLELQFSARAKAAGLFLSIA
jgi:hypothetical protein